MPSIVSINCVEQVTQRSFFGQSQTYDAESAGSGIIVKETKNKLYIVTNNHVIDGADSVTVTFIDDSTVAAEVKGTDSASDLAVLEISLDDLDSDTLSQIKVAAMGDSDEVLVGQTAIAIGNALGYGQSVTTGVISALNREVTVENVTNELLQTDAAINPGNSGGALLNAKGEVIGINSAKYSDTDVEGMGYAIPINTAAPIIEQLIDKEIVSEDKAGYLGIKGVDVSDSVASTYDLPSGVYVGYVAEGAAADTAGIVKGDIITGFEGRTITSMEDLQNQLQYYAAGTTVTVTIERANNGEYVEQEISVTLGEKVGTTTESSDEDSSEDSGNSQQNGGSSDDQEDSYSDFFNYYGSDDNSSNGFFQIP
jgi:serine protease Do